LISDIKIIRALVG